MAHHDLRVRQQEGSARRREARAARGLAARYSRPSGADIWPDASGSELALHFENVRRWRQRLTMSKTAKKPKKATRPKKRVAMKAKPAPTRAKKQVLQP